MRIFLKTAPIEQDSPEQRTNRYKTSERLKRLEMEIPPMPEEPPSLMPLQLGAIAVLAIITAAVIVHCHNLSRETALINESMQFYQPAIGNDNSVSTSAAISAVSKTTVPAATSTPVQVGNSLLEMSAIPVITKSADIKMPASIASGANRRQPIRLSALEQTH